MDCSCRVRFYARLVGIVQASCLIRHKHIHHDRDARYNATSPSHILFIYIILMRIRIFDDRPRTRPKPSMTSMKWTFDHISFVWRFAPSNYQSNVDSGICVCCVCITRMMSMTKQASLSYTMMWNDIWAHWFYINPNDTVWDVFGRNLIGRVLALTLSGAP